MGQRSPRDDCVSERGSEDPVIRLLLKLKQEIQNIRRKLTEVDR